MSRASTMTRKWTCRVLDAMDEGAIAPNVVAEACLNYMSESDVEDMCRINDFFLEEENEEC